MIGQRFVSLFARGLGTLLLQRLRDTQMHRLPLLQADRVVDHVARDAVLETQRARAFAGEEEVLLGQAAHQRVVFAVRR